MWVWDFLEIDIFLINSHHKVVHTNISEWKINHGFYWHHQYVSGRNCFWQANGKIPLLAKCINFICAYQNSSKLLCILPKENYPKQEQKQTKKKKRKKRKEKIENLKFLGKFQAKSSQKAKSFWQNTKLQLFVCLFFVCLFVCLFFFFQITGILIHPISMFWSANLETYIIHLLTFQLVSLTIHVLHFLKSFSCIMWVIG